MKSSFLFMIGWLLSFTASAQLMITEEPATITTPVGNVHGTLKVPSNKKAIPVALFIAGSGPTDRNSNSQFTKNNSFKMLSDNLFMNGIATLCYDKRGIAESKTEQKEEDLRFDDYVDDVRTWIDTLSKDKRFSEIIVVGHSEGSLLGMIACGNNPKVSKFVSIAGVGEPAGNVLRKQLEKQLAGQPAAVKDMIFSYIEKLEQGEKLTDVPMSLYSLFRPSVQPYMISWLKYNPQTEIAKLTIPTLIVQGTTDIQVGVEQAELLANAYPKAKKVIIKNMNHVLKDCESTETQDQLPTYNNPDLPLNKEISKVISDFIKEK